MSTSRLHIPFPRTFLTVNTPAKKSGSFVEPSAAPESEQPAHPFLSNQSTASARHGSMSSIKSDDSDTSPTSGPTGEPFASPVFKATLPAFLSLNSKHATPPKTAKEMTALDKHLFLSNKH